MVDGAAAQECTHAFAKVLAEARHLAQSHEQTRQRLLPDRHLHVPVRVVGPHVVKGLLVQPLHDGGKYVAGTNRPRRLVAPGHPKRSVAPRPYLLFFVLLGDLVNVVRGEGKQRPQTHAGRYEEAGEEAPPRRLAAAASAAA